YRDAVTKNLRSDDSGVVPTPALALDLFPLARESTAFLRDLGLFGDFKAGLVQDKPFTTGMKVPISWTRFSVGLKYRIWIERDWKAPMIALSASYGQESYSFGSAGPPEPLDTPSAAYKILRPRLDARVPIGPIVVIPGLGFLGI